jgi:thioesterase domain-containing protein/acyl carrier protein
VTYREVSERDVMEARGSLVGGAIDDLQLYILDRNMSLAPTGVSGEIFVGGAGLARGYLNRPDASAERFAPDPFSRKPGSRLYRTGDLARYLPTGDIEYLGRIDDQVKVRGFRIELGEIEAAILAHNGVGQAAIIVREDTPGDKRLAAYVVPARQPAPGVDELRSFLRDRLPEHMVPSVFETLEELPLTANGKLDRQALPAPGQGRGGLSTAYESPRNNLESMLAKLWRDVLGLEDVGINDDFFETGGDSIKVAILINRLQQEFDEIIHVVSIFKAPTIAQLASYLEAHYAEAVLKVCGKASPKESESNKDVSLTEASGIDSAKVARLRELIPPLSPRTTDRRLRASKNRPAIFILSPPRSGSTLMRVMLGGHPLLFSPPELELLSFNSLEERRATFLGADSVWLEGTIRAIMEIKNCDADRAKALMQEFEERRLDTKQFFRWMQDCLGERQVVDKTPSYTLSKTILERIEEDFDSPLYIHLLRHPHATIQSFVEARLDQIFFRYEHPFSRRELAELIWIVSHQNILEFLDNIPPGRQHRVRFEDLVGHPHPVMQGLCEFLGLELQPEMLQPYSDQKKKMTDGLYAESRMLGDVKFHTYTKIEPAVGGRWKESLAEGSLGEPTWQVAEALGYARGRAADRSTEEAVASSPTDSTGSSPVVELQSGAFNRPFFCVHSAEGGAVQFAQLAICLGPDQPFYGIQGLNPAAPYIEIEERAARYNQALRRIQPDGPYLLGGWSYGGLVAFEMANQLSRNGHEVALLALMDPMTPIPGNEYTDYASIDTEDPVTLLEHIGELIGGQLELRLDYLRQLTGDELLNHILQQAKMTSILPPEIDAVDLVPWLRGYRAKLQSARNYVPAVYSGRITLFTTKSISLESNSAGDGSSGDDSVAVWRGLSSAPVEVHAVSGTHHTMIQEPDVRELAGLLRECIQRATDNSGARQGEKSYSQTRPNELNTGC